LHITVQTRGKLASSGIGATPELQRFGDAAYGSFSTEPAGPACYLMSAFT
jgi:hypothetical protein